MSSSQTEISSESTNEIKESKKYKVILLNDNKTTFEFVCEVFMKIFDKSQKEAEDLTMEVHIKGSALGGIYSKSVAEVKQLLVHEFAKEKGYPFQCIIEEN